MSGDCLPVSVCPTARLLAASSTSLIIWGAGTCHNQCPLQPAMHLCFWTTCSKLFQASNQRKETPQTSNIETLHLPPSGCIRTNIIPRSKDWTNGRPFSKVYIWASHKLLRKWKEPTMPGAEGNLKILILGAAISAAASDQFANKRTDNNHSRLRKLITWFICHIGIKENINSSSTHLLDTSSRIKHWLFRWYLRCWGQHIAAKNPTAIPLPVFNWTQSNLTLRRKKNLKSSHHKHQKHKA